MDTTECQRRIEESLTRLTHNDTRSLTDILTHLKDIGIRGCRLVSAPIARECRGCLLYEYLRADSGVPWNQFQVGNYRVLIFSISVVNVPQGEHPFHLGHGAHASTPLPQVLQDLVAAFDTAEHSDLVVS